jgi:hypothetical protein
MLTPSGVDGSRTWKKKSDRLQSEKHICSWSSTKLGRQKILIFYFVVLNRCLPATVAPLLACPQTVVLCLALSLSLSQVSPFTFVLNCLSSIVMGTKGFWWERKECDGNLMRTKGYWWVIDGNERTLMRTFWELDGNKRNLIEIWWEQKSFWWVIDRNKRNLMRIFWELDENKRIMMGYWWE